MPKQTDKNKKKKLTGKQEKFCREYVLCCNGTKAAEKAGYSKDTAYSIACENLKKPEIKARIAELRKSEEEDFYYSRSIKSLVLVCLCLYCAMQFRFTLIFLVIAIWLEVYQKCLI